MAIFASMDASASALTAERFRMDLIANNLANVNTTRTAAGGPYRREVPLFRSRESDFASLLAARILSGQGWPAGDGSPVMPTGGVQVAAVVEDTTPGPMRYEPGHPDADATGWVAMPNVDPVVEMVDLMAATRTYQANVTAITEEKNLFLRSLDIARS